MRQERAVQTQVNSFQDQCRWHKSHKRKGQCKRVNETVKNRGRETSFKTMGKSGRNKVSFQDMENEVSKAISFKTIDKSGTKRVSFKTTEETNNISIHFKTFDEWIKTRKANKSISFKTFDEWVKERTEKCDTQLKASLSFVSGTKSARDGEKD